ncbi:MAG: NUDIX domain-containing protein [Defluviitaleaceae bacterium]|nr:NUDIX domain-containing protein [Defluviitaleaceae bacterium]
MIRNEITATGLVFNESGHILMIKHKRQGKWLPPGGHVDANELPCEAAAREVLEETGVKVQVLSSVPALGLSDNMAKELPLPLRIICADVEGTGLHNHIDLLYLCKAKNVDTTPQEAEIDGIGWFSPEEAMKLDTYEDIIKSIEMALRLINMP